MTQTIVDRDASSFEYPTKPIGFFMLEEEALTISIYCAFKFSDDWSRGTLAAVNHSGDNDFTGSITGAILGTLLG